ncbi:hypothetical protein ACOSQ2_022181 [Xanthoceras sorbifolium]
MVSSSSNVMNTSSSAMAGASAFSSPFTSQLNFNMQIKLDENNYLFWRAQVLPAIRAYNLEDYIFEVKPVPKKFIEVRSTDSDETVIKINDDFLTWKKNDQLLVCWLISTLSQPIIGQVNQCSTAYEV